MTQLEFNKYGFWTMCLLNVLVLTYVLLSRPNRPEGGPPAGRQGAKEKLELDDDQHNAFRSLADAHHIIIDSIDKAQQVMLEPYFKSIGDTSLMDDTPEMLNAYQQLEGRKVAISLAHFKDVKALLRPDQYANFDNFMEDISQRLFSKGERSPPLRRDRK